MESQSIQTLNGKFIVFNLDEHRYILPVAVVERVVRAVEITPLPKAPDIILGVINIGGRVIPVINVRKRFRLSEREIDPGDQLIVAHTARRTVALVADAVDDVIERPENVISPEEILPGMDYVEGVVKLEDGLAIIHNLDKFLSFKEEETLNDAMSDI